jgi:hypothetical protein
MSGKLEEAVEVLGELSPPAKLDEGSRAKLVAIIESRRIGKDVPDWRIEEMLAIEPDESRPKERVAIRPEQLHEGLVAAGLLPWLRLLGRQVVPLDQGAPVIAAITVLDAIELAAPMIQPDGPVWPALEAAHAALPEQVRTDHPLAPVLAIAMQHPSWAKAEGIPAAQLDAREIGLARGGR